MRQDYHILQFPARGVIKLFVEDIFPPEIYALPCLAQAFAFAFDTDRPPHQALERVLDINYVNQIALVFLAEIINRRQFAVNPAGSELPTRGPAAD